MSTLGQIRTAIGDTMTANLSGVEVYSRVADVVVLPAIVVLPAEADFTVTMGRGTDRWEFDLYVLVGRGVIDEEQDGLDAFINGSGSSSIRQVVFQNRTLGLSDVNAHVSGMSRYGGSFDVAQVEHVGAVLRLVVLTSGS